MTRLTAAALAASAALAAPAALAASAALAALATLAACRGHEAVPSGEQGAGPRDAAVDAAEPPREPWRCAVPDEPAAPEETFTVGGRTWRLAGHALVLVAADSGGRSAATGAAPAPAPATPGGAIRDVVTANSGGRSAAMGAAPAPATPGSAMRDVVTANNGGRSAAMGAAPAPATPGGAKRDAAIAVRADSGGRSATTGAAPAPASSGGAMRDVAIAMIADSAGSAPATLAALGRLRARFGDADIVVSLGGMGSTTSELDAVFATLADGAAWPVVAMPGDLEAVPAQVEAIAAARKRGAVVIDGRRVQRIELPGVTIGLAPGAGAAARLVAGAAGCRYERAGVAAVLASRPGLRVLATAEPPRSDGDPPTGELAITASPDVIDLALHGGSDAATAARSGKRDGSATALTPGSSDALPRLTSRRRSPTAGLLRIHGSAWSWQPLAHLH